MNSQNKGPAHGEPLHIQLKDAAHENDDAKTQDEERAATLRPANNSDSLARKGRGLRNHASAIDNEEELPPSKTRIKKQMHELRDLGVELTELGKDQLAQLDLPENLRDAIHEMKHINKFGAQRRQIQYIGKLMREVDTGPILAKLDAWKGTSNQHLAHLHQIERWRDRLLESDGALTELLASHPKIDAQHLRTLIRNARREIDSGKAPKGFREIFQVLKVIIPDSK